ncbi:MAG: hypothetical protein JXB30_15540 [Anaerolineae bacterium]|nr:hypothetical protein [Anaerolineae bacterium]
MSDTPKAELPKRRRCGPQDIAGLMRTIFSAEDDDITCGECYEHIDEYVDMLRAGEDAATVLPKVKAHLEQCPCCKMEFQAFVAILEAETETNRDEEQGA